MRLIPNIKSDPANAASLKMAHFSNIGVTEVFLEATPTTMVSTVLMASALENRDFLYDILIGNNGSGILFFLGYSASILSSAMGVSRYLEYFFKIRIDLGLDCLGFSFME